MGTLLFLKRLPAAFLFITLLSNNSGFFTKVFYTNSNSPISSAPLGVQSPGPWTNFSPYDGLLSNSIISLNQDSNQYLWVGTSYGLSLLSPAGLWATLTDANGLAGNTIMRIINDPTNNHYHWIASYGGGTLIDDGGDPSNINGMMVESWGTSDGLVNSYVSALALDSNEQVWFGTDKIDSYGDETGYGISVLNTNGTPFNKSDDTWITYTTSNSGLSSNVIHDIVVDNRGVVWIATQYGLDAFYNGVWTTFTNYDSGLVSSDITSLLFYNNLLWVGTTGGLSVLNYGSTPSDKSDDQWRSFTQYNSGLVDNRISTLGADSLGRIWIGTDYKGYNAETGSGFSVLNTNNTPFYPNDDTWRSFNTSNGLADPTVRAILPLGNSIAWVATKQGLSYFNDNNTLPNTADDYWKTYTASNRLIGSSVLAVAGGGSQIWFGTDLGLNLLQYNYTPHVKQDDTWFYYPFDINNDGIPDEVRAIAVDQKNRVWIGTNNGLVVLDINNTPSNTSDDHEIIYTTQNSPLVNNQINDIYIDQYGNGWVASGNYFSGGVNVINLGYYLDYPWDDNWATFTPSNSQLPNPYVTSITPGSGNTMWFGTHFGAALLSYGVTPFIKVDDQWTIYKQSNSGIADDNINDIAIDPAGNVWFALELMGVSVRTVDGSWVTFNRMDGLAQDLVRSVAVDKSGQIWFGTDGSGISVLNVGSSIKDKSDDTWTTYNRGTGLISDNIRNIFVDNWGQMWVGALGGASVYSTVIFYRISLPLVRR